MLGARRALPRLFGVGAALAAGLGGVRNFSASAGVLGTHFWLRHETKPNEGRTALLPYHAKDLLDRGHAVTVERSPARCVEDEEYEKVGCKLAETNSWVQAPLDAVILGLKELPDEIPVLQHRHIYFAHCYKNQTGWEEILGRFVDGGGHLYDLEFLLDDSKKRVAAFGWSAGYAGTAVALQAWALQKTAPEEKLSKRTPFKTFEDMAAHTREQLEKAPSMPKVVVVGANGRSGLGSAAAAKASGVPEENITLWDRTNTESGGPFPELLTDFDVLSNCIYLGPDTPVFFNKRMLRRKNRRLSVIGDVSCDPNNANNPIPIYSECTTVEEPVLRVLEDKQGPLDVVSIDHLPCLVPYESSKEFTDDLVKHLYDFDDSPVWQGASLLFEEKVMEAEVLPDA